jgi:Fe-S-cluster containining protein
MSKKHDREMAAKYGPFRDGKRLPWLTINRLLEIYREVSTNHIHCPAGCHECCKKGTEVSVLEQILLEAYCAFKGYAVHTRGKIINACPYVSPMGLCQVYPVRPFMCRVYGLTEGEDLSCEIGQKPEHAKFGYNDMRDRFVEITYHPGKMVKVPTPEELHIALLKLTVLAGKEPSGEEPAQCTSTPVEVD